MRLFFSVGEPSGDLHGANLIRELREREPRVACAGFGGPKMQQAGCELDADLTELAVMGFARVVPHLLRFGRLLWQAELSFRQQRPAAVILIDYPGFNWWVARRAKRYGIPVFYYGTPQLWAWATHRVKKLRRYVDHALCKLPFEPAWYREHECEATYVGHPYFDNFLRHPVDSMFVASLGSRPLVTLLPGSRRHEVLHNLPAFLRTIDYVQPSVPQARFAIASYNQEQAGLARQLLEAHRGHREIEIHVDRTRELIRAANCCLACSGSVSLELLHESKPTVIHYRIGRPMDVLQRRYRRCKFITLVNLLASEHRFERPGGYNPDDTRYLDEAPFPEYLTVKDRAAEMAHHLVRWLLNPSLREQQIRRLRPLREEFVKPGASRLAATYILEHLQRPAAEICLPMASKVA